MKRPLTRSISRWLIRWRHGLLGIAAVLVIMSWLVPRQVEFDRSVQNLISTESDVLASFRRLKRSFGGNEIVLAVYQDADLLATSGEGIRRLATISQRLEAIPGVRSTLSLNKLMGELITSRSNGVAIRMRKLFEGYTHNAAGNIAVVVCMLQPEDETTPPRRETIDSIRATVEHLPNGLPAGMITGEPVMLVDGFRFVERDGERLSRWSSALLGLTILVCFRSLRWMLICVGVVQLALLLTKASLSLLGLRLSMVSSMLTAVVTVVGVATVVHVIVRFRDARQQGKQPLRALAQTTRILLVPVFWACITDAAGFAALQSASVRPVRDFGLMMAISCLSVLVSVWLLVPALSTIGPTPSIRRSAGALDSFLRRALRGFAELIARRPVPLAVLTTLLVGFSLWGLQFLEVETDFTRNFRADSQIVKAYRFVEDNLGGAGVGDILIPAPKPLTWNYLRQVRQLEERIETEAQKSGPLRGVTKVLSLADAVLVGAPQLDIYAQSTFSSRLVTQSGLGLMRSRVPAFYDALYSADPEQGGQHYLRIMFRAREQQDAAQKRALISRLEELSREQFPDITPGPPEVTGFYVLLAHLIDSIVQDQWKTFLVAIVGIALTMLLAFRNVPLAITALIPNALPVLVVSGLMGWMKWSGWFDFRINMGSAMIAAVSLGLSIDSSIHYIFAFRRAKLLGNTSGQAIAVAHRTVGLSMIFATVALIVGFSVLATSQFTPTVYFGSLVSLAMLGGLLGNLVVLPVVLRWQSLPAK